MDTCDALQGLVGEIPSPKPRSFITPCIPCVLVCS